LDSDSYTTDRKETTMVMRTIEIKEIKYEVDKERRGGVISRLYELYRDQLDIFTDGILLVFGATCITTKEEI
jgi:hypothetical protein